MQRILLIGSNSELLLALRAHRPLAGCVVEICPGNVETLRALHARAYDVVVTDPRTSVREDLALVEEIRAVRPGVRTLVLALEAAPEEVLAALRAKVSPSSAPRIVAGRSPAWSSTRSPTRLLGGMGSRCARGCRTGSPCASLLTWWMPNASCAS